MSAASSMTAFLRFAASGIAARATCDRLDRAARQAPLADSFVRRNYRGRAVSLAGGPALATAALAAIVSDRRIGARVRLAAAVAGGVAVIAGALDDARGSHVDRGVRGHLRALHRGEVTTGAVKIVSIGAAGVAAGWCLDDGRPWRKTATGLAIAASANAANLLDLRPGRALKSALLVAAPLTLSRRPGRRAAGVIGGAAAGLLAPELDERVMLGDAGANCLGAITGVALLAGASSRRVVTTLGALLALTAASELVSFSRVIESTPLLRWIDRWGRQGADPDRDA